MSQLIVPSHTIVHSIPIGRRIREIMKEKGMAFTLSSMSNRIGIHRETLRKMLSGERPIYTFELDNIAKDLKVSAERILQVDIQDAMSKLMMLLEEGHNPDHALELASELEHIALGYQEKCEALNNLGRAQYLLRQYDLAHQTWLEAYNYAKLASDHFGDTKTRFHITSNLLLTYHIRQEYTNMHSLISEIKDALGTHPVISGKICYSLAKIYERQCNTALAAEYYNKSLEFYQMTNLPLPTGKARHNLACFEYRMMNYSKAKKLFEIAIDELTEDRYHTLICTKEYCKTLLKLGDSNLADQLIDRALDQINSEEYRDLHELRAMYSLLKARANDEPSLAEIVLNSENVSENLRNTAGEFLIQFYESRDDSISMMKYYREVMRLSSCRVDILDKEAL